MRRLMVVVMLATACCGCDWFSITCTDRVERLKARQDELQRREDELTARIDAIGHALLAIRPDDQQKLDVDAYFRQQAEKVIHENGGLPRICTVYVTVPGMDHAYWVYTVTNDQTQVSTERK